MQQAKKLMFFSFPMMLVGLAYLYIGFGDRYFLRVFDGLDAVGIYALAYKFGFMLVMVAWGPFLSVWNAQCYDIYKLDNAKELFQKVFVLASSILILGALGIVLFVEDLLKIMSEPAFWPAADLVPIIVVAYVCQSLTDYCRFGLLLKEKTKKIAYISILTAGVISIGYIGLIPDYGSWGAAIATLVAFAFMLAYTHFSSRQLYNMHLPWRRVFLAFALGCVVYSLRAFAPEALIASIAYSIGLTLLFLVCYFLLPILDAEQKQRLITAVKNRDIKALTAESEGPATSL